MKALAYWYLRMAFTTDHGEHLPLQEDVLERWNCDGIACSSRKICLELGGWAKRDTSWVIQYFLMELRNPEEQVRLEAMRKRMTGREWGGKQLGFLRWKYGIRRPQGARGT
jgi:hypothetical protein